VLPLHPRAARSSSVSATATSILGTWVGQPEGFIAATAAVRGWPITQRARETMTGDRRGLATKLERVVEVAREVWGAA
jgi:hypothetical protein